ncbi:hypothetical protein SEUCBS139899_008062 [Sporothrix eucalyptigena]|uniref:Major facilitator superfamily (MFS) profile domain-containing protein n=1 Tax=Sporothrix eucalyptigena TaxID=1812306 RepID=A0ABP0CCS3_9PEZI
MSKIEENVNTVVCNDESQHIETGSSDGEVVMVPQHRDYLLARHGTIDLEPIPFFDDADPLNWPKRRKIVNLVLVAFHAMMCTFTAACIQSAFVKIAEDLDISVQKASYLTSLVIAILGGAPLFWRPIAEIYGRRPIFLLSLICSLVCNIGCAQSHSYATMALCRALTAFFISPPIAIGSGVVTEMFFKKDRALYMGIWTTMTTLGVPVSPFICGFIALRVGYRWIYYVLAITNGVQFILYFFLGRESRYIGGNQAASAKPGFVNTYLNFRRIDPNPLRPVEFIRPLFMVVRPCVIIPTAAYAMVFLWSCIMISIEIPQLYSELFGFNTQQLGLQNLALIIGTVLGEQIGGRMSDAWMWHRHRRGHFPAPEYRLWLSYIGFGLAICGVVVFLVQLDHSGNTWNITPLVGVAIASAGNQVVTTVMITYIVDCYREEAASIGVFVTFVRQTWGFIGPFWFPQMLANLGLVKSVGVPIALIVAVSIVPTIFVQWLGSRWRK